MMKTLNNKNYSKNFKKKMLNNYFGLRGLKI